MPPDLYYIHELKPWQQRVARSLRKDGKAYLFDWSEVEDAGARFENLVANHLRKAVDFWTDTGEGSFSLCYLRDKQKREIDFVVVRDRRPWLAIEAKRDDTSLAPAWRTFLPRIGCDVGVLIVRAPGHWTWHDLDGARVLVASASEVLAYFVSAVFRPTSPRSGMSPSARSAIWPACDPSPGWDWPPS